MSGKLRYKNGARFLRMCGVLKISSEQVLRRAGLPASLLSDDSRGMDAKQFFAMWEAAHDEAKEPDLPLRVAKIAAAGPLVSPVFAFSCSPNIETGLQRLALFKPLVGPIRLELERDEKTFSIRFRSADPEAPIPNSMAPFEVSYFLELARNHTGEHIVPLAVQLPGEYEAIDAFNDHYGIAANKADTCSLILSREDSRRPLISENEELWAEFEPSLRRRLSAINQDALASVRVKNALLELLPSGQSSVEAVCDKLSVSKRSLQRQLKAENKSFQGILDATRSELSLHYLSKDEMSIEEISYLLAYRDPNSFYRAFQVWTGMTPMQARGLQAH